MRRIVFFILGLLFLIAAIFGVRVLHDRSVRTQAIAEQDRVVRPPVQPLSAGVHVSSQDVSSMFASSVQASSTRASEINMDVPFYVQAPLVQWDAVHEEACEEASILMVLSYFGRQTFTTPEEVDAALLALVDRAAALGFPVDLTAEQVRTVILDAMPSLDVSLLNDPTVEQLQNALRDGSLIIVPAAGRSLGNPYFQTPGPLYHMLVLRGFTRDGYVITNDPGTRRGEAYVYRWDKLLDAMHDWNGGSVDQGKKVVISIQHPSP